MENTVKGMKPIAAGFLGSSAVRAIALRSLGFVSGAAVGSEAQNQGDISTLSFRAECLRAALWASSNRATTPVYVTRLLSVAEPLLKPDPDFATDRTKKASESLGPDDLLRETLEEMELIGDVCRLPHGYWLPSPLRVVLLNSLERHLVIGGTPIGALPGMLSTRLDFSGVARFASEVEEKLPTESEENWCGLPKQDVDKWSAGILERAELQEFDDKEIEFEMYAPGLKGVRRSQDGFQLHRWTGVLSALPDGRYLARQKLFRGRTHYAVVEVRRTKIVRTGGVDVREGGIRRLMYGIDLLAKCPVRVLVERGNVEARFILGNEVPRSEHRLLTALARLQLPDDGRYYPRLWVSSAKYVPQIEAAFERLGVHVEDRKKI
jgi:hypothetical protein